MYVCLCHGITDRQIAGIVGDGCRSAADVYARLGRKPRCGKCVPDVKAMLAGVCAGPVAGAPACAALAPAAE